MKHGGKFLQAESYAFERMFLSSRNGHIDWIPDLLFNTSEPLLVDDFSSIQICLIGTLAYVDAVFRNRLKKELASYHSPASSCRTPFGDHLFETNFSIMSIESHFQTLDRSQTYSFLKCLCRTGSVSMMKPFIDIGIDVNGGGLRKNLLGHAAAVGNVDMVYMLLKAGANGSFAIKTFLDSSKALPNAPFRRLLGLLLENARHASFVFSKDPLLVVIRSSRALYSYPKAPEILLERDCYTKESFGEWTMKSYGEKTIKPPFFFSHMYQAISSRNASVVDLLLHNGARVDVPISHSFDCTEYWFGSCTWLTFAVTFGVTACADVLIRNGADVTALDGDGKSAIQLAKINAVASHPRIIPENHPWEISGHISAEQDAATLAVVERAFNLKFHGTKSIEDFLDPSDENTPQPLPPQENPVPKLQKALEKTLGILFTPSQTELLLKRLEPHYRDIRKIWSLRFHEALLMRSMYVLSYTILLTYELQALIRGKRRIPMPSRFILSAFALLALALIWGSSSQGVFSWDFFSAETKPETES